ncbi:coiled-coil domain-containing protein 181 [Plakobranchus ocellatus]|uniref:Coiled-coil domain-containing protein 181 n=1 Tax=Plakobranchus ocellatus TaxID=259542 RepID=A0AAV3ZIG6_9GAST|nr:coiled-coil domain-containing protein 181 [Plakobranchus ocellatus]
MEHSEGASTLVQNNNNNDNYNNYNSTKNAKMTSAENTSYEDDFEKDTSSDSASQQNGRPNDGSNGSNSENTAIKKSEDSYEDDFEKDLSMEDQSHIVSSPRKSSDDANQDNSNQGNSPSHIPHPPPSSDTNRTSPTEKENQSEAERSQQRHQPPPLDLEMDLAPPLSGASQSGPQADLGASDNESEEPDADAYNFTEDQRRAMLELMVQKQEDVDLLDEEPPEYNVKGRLEQLNAELANDPAPVEGERETRVGFKAEIVDLVAPPQDFSDDDASQPNSARDDSSGGSPFHSSKPSPFSATSSESSVSSNASPSQPPKASPFAASEARSNGSDDVRGKKEEGKNDEEEEDTKKLTEDPNKKQFVVERDGQFSVLSANELTPSERAMLMEEGAVDASKKKHEQSDSQRNKDNRGHGHTSTAESKPNGVVPRPPSQPRPNTAAASNGGRRSLVRQGAQQSPRPKSADNHQLSKRGTASSSSSSHSSGLSDDFNYRSPYARSEEVRELSREQSRRQEEERREKERRRKEEEQQRREYNDSAFQAWLRKKREENQRRATENQDNKERSDEERVKENEEAYKAWLKEKRVQGKREKLLQRRQQQEKMDGYFMRPREECEQAFKEWLKKKNADLRRQQSLERQKSRMYRVQVKRSRKTQALVRALKESQAFRYVDYYGYRY